MPISPIAPDYVSQVRGIIGDLRDNYLKKQQLFQQQEQADANLALNYAQLGLQRENAANQLNLNKAQLAVQESNHQAQLAQDRAKFAASLQESQLRNKIDNDKLAFDREKQQELAKQKALEIRQEQAAGPLAQEAYIALNSDNPQDLIEWGSKLNGSILNSAQRKAVIENAKILVETKQKLDNEIKTAERNLFNVQTRPEVEKIMGEMTSLIPKISTMDSTEVAQRMTDFTKRFADTKNTDPSLSTVFFNTLQTLGTSAATARSEKAKADITDFEREAITGRLPQADQKAWDDLHSVEYPDENQRALSQDFQNKKTRLMFSVNNARSQEQLKRMAQEENLQAEYNVKRDPTSGVWVDDPETGKKVLTYKNPPVDLTPRVGDDGAIDPVTGKLTKRILDQHTEWMKVARSSYTPMTMQNMFMGQMMQPPPSQPAEQQKPGQGGTAEAAPIRIFNPSRFAETQAPGTTTIPVAPQSGQGGQVKLSDETIMKVVQAYNSNPDSLVNGRPIKDIVARLLSQGISLPGLRQLPESNIVEGQKR